MKRLFFAVLFGITSLMMSAHHQATDIVFTKEDSVRVRRLQEELAWLNMDAIRLAFADMKRSASYNSGA